MDNLLYNYNGLNNMKDDFAKMLYASSSKIFVSKKGSELLEDGVRLHRNSKQQLNATMHDQKLELTKNKEIKARHEKSSLEVFEI